MDKEKQNQLAQSVPPPVSLNPREVMATIASWLGERVNSIMVAMTAIGVPHEAHTSLASGLLLSLSLKFADARKLKELEEQLRQIQKSVEEGHQLSWSEENVRRLFSYFDLYMQATFNEKRIMIGDIIRRFVCGQGPSFPDDDLAYFIKVTEQLSLSDIEYFVWAVERGRFDKFKPEEKPEQRHQLYGVGSLADKDPNRYRNLMALTGLGLVSINNVFGGLSYVLTPVALSYYEFLKGQTAAQTNTQN